MPVRVLILSREKSGWLKSPSSPSNFSISWSKELYSAKTPSSQVWKAELASCLDENSFWSLTMDSWSLVIEVLCASMADLVSFALLIQEILLGLNWWSEDKEARIEGHAFIRSLNAMTRLFSHSTLKPIPLASPSVERSSSKERVRLFILPLDCSWDMTSPIRPNIKLLRESVHFSVSPTISGYFKSSLEHTAFKRGESNEISGLESALVLSLSWSLEVTSVKSSFS